MNINWKSIDLDDFYADHLGFRLRVEQLSENSWWWAVYQIDQPDIADLIVNEIVCWDYGNGSAASSEKQAKELCEQAFYELKVK